MVTAADNLKLTQVGPDSEMGQLLRHYWFPVATASELEGETALKVRILGEDLVLYRSYDGQLGLIAAQCPHRRCSLVFGIPETGGIRCAYHGWLFDLEGNCVEQPSEPESSRFFEKIHTPAYPAQEMGGLIFGYLGPKPVPLLPRFDYFVEENAIRQIGITHLPANWLQIVENGMDPLHTEWLHAYLSNFQKTGETKSSLGHFPQTRHERLEFELFEFGIMKKRLYVGSSEEGHEWKVGHPVVFPMMLKQGRTFQIRIPVDDENTLLYWYDCFDCGGVEVPPQEVIPTYDYPFLDAEGRFLVKEIRQQDLAAWVSQGAVADRTKENLASSDRGIVMYRNLLNEQLERVARGEDPIGVLRDPARSGPIQLTSDEVGIPRPWMKGLEEDSYLEAYQKDLEWRFQGSPIQELIVKIFLERERQLIRGGPESGERLAR